MPDLIFARTRHQYGSYVDWWKLVDLSDYPTVYVDEIDPWSDNIYIFTPANGETVNGWPGARARIILYQLEWNLDGSHSTPPGVRETWAGDRHFAEKNNYRYVPLGSHPGLNELPANQRHVFYDVAFMGYREPARRARMLHQISGAGLTIAPDDWGLRRSELLLQSGCMAIIHQWDHSPGVAPLRMCIAAAHRLPVISETVPDAGVFTNAFMLQCTYSTLPYFIRDRVKDRYRTNFDDHGNALYAYLCEQWTFKKSIEAAL